MSRGEFFDEYRDPALARRRVSRGRGCPVRFTPLETLDRATAIAEQPEAAFTGFGAMLRGPGSQTGLLSLRARGTDVRLRLSELRLLRRSRERPTAPPRLRSRRVKTHRRRPALGPDLAARYVVDLPLGGQLPCIC
ncbi:hypothetical protein [Streptomyces phaeochromogenes]